jgi:hypothetical protein
LIFKTHTRKVALPERPARGCTHCRDPIHLVGKLVNTSLVYFLVFRESIVYEAGLFNAY